MTGPPIPAAVHDLLRAHVENYEHLEILLRLHREPSREWNATTAAQELRIDEATAVGALAHLAAAGLLEPVPPARTTYRYLPATPDLDAAVTALAHAYDHNRVQVMMTMSRNALERLRTAALKTFADAFRVRGKGKKDG